MATVSNYEQYGYFPATDQDRVDNVVIPEASGTGFAEPAIPVVMTIE